MSAVSILAAVLPPYLLHSLIVFVAVLVSMAMPELPAAGFVNPLLPPGTPFVEKLIKWDSHWYTYAAMHGYDERSIVFFPVIIMLLRLLTLLGIDMAVGGVLVCNVFGLFSFVLLYLIVKKEFSDAVARRSLYALALMPTSFYLNMIYTEPLFLTFALGTFYFLRQKKWWVAAFMAAMATLTRNLGIFLVAALGYELAMSGRHRHQMRAWLAVVLPPLSLLAFMVYSWVQVGDAMAFLHGQQTWGRHFNYPWINIWNNIQLIVNDAPEVEPGIVLDLLLVFLALTALLMTTLMPSFRVRRSLLVVGWTWLLIPLCSTTPWFPLYSLARFTLVIIPLYIWLALLPRRLYHAYLVCGGILLAYGTIGFCSWRWLG